MYEFNLQLGFQPKNVRLSGDADGLPRTHDEPAVVEVRETQVLLETLRRVEQLLDTLERSRQGRIDDWKRTAIDLAVLALGRIICRQIGRDEFPVESVVEEMITGWRNKAAIRVYLHPLDLAAVERRLDLTTDTVANSLPKIQFLPDPSLSRGSCRAEDDDDLLISDLSQRLESLHRAMAGGNANVAT